MRISHLKKTMEKFTEIKTYRVGKTTCSSLFLITLRFQGYRCKSGIAIFACGPVRLIEITPTVLPLGKNFT